MTVYLLCAVLKMLFLAIPFFHGHIAILMRLAEQLAVEWLEDSSMFPNFNGFFIRIQMLVVGLFRKAHLIFLWPIYNFRMKRVILVGLSFFSSIANKNVRISIIMGVYVCDAVIAL